MERFRIFEPVKHHVVHKYKILLIWSLVWLLGPVQSHGQYAHSYVEGISIENLHFYLDTAAQKTLEDFSNLKDADASFFERSGYVVKFPVWISLQLTNTTRDTQTAVLAVNKLDTIIFHTSRDGKYTTYLRGRNIYVANTKSNNERCTYTCVLAPNGSEKRVICLKPSRVHYYSNQYQLELYTRENITELAVFDYYSQRSELIQVIVFLSILLFQVLFVSLQGVMMRRTYYVHYVSYILVIGVYYLSRYEFDLQWDIVFSRYPILSVKLNDILLFLPFYFYYRFARSFCEVSVVNPVLSQKIIGAERFILGFCISVFMVGHFFPRTGFYAYWMLSGVVIFLLMSVYFLYHIYQFKSTIARILVAGSLVALLTSVLANLLSYVPLSVRLLLPNPLTITMAGVLVETIIFNAGLVFKARQSEVEQLKIQKRLVAETREKLKIEKEYFDERNRIASDLHDDIGATLSSIGIYSDAALSKMQRGDAEKAQQILRQIGSNARVTMSNMSDIVWAINPLNDEQGHLADKIESYVLALLQTSELKYDLDLDRSPNLTRMSLRVRKNVFLVFKEAVNNVMKYAGADLLQVSLKEKDGSWELIVRDNGSGMSEKVQGGGNGLRNMQHRAGEIGGTLKIDTGPQGTAVTLNIPSSGD